MCPNIKGLCVHLQTIIWLFNVGIIILVDVNLLPVF